MGVSSQRSSAFTSHPLNKALRHGAGGNLLWLITKISEFVIDFWFQIRKGSMLFLKCQGSLLCILICFFFRSRVTTGRTWVSFVISTKNNKSYIFISA